MSDLNDAHDEHQEPEILMTMYGLGDDGAYDINLYKVGEEYFFKSAVHGPYGPYSSQQEAEIAMEECSDFGDEIFNDPVIAEDEWQPEPLKTLWGLGSYGAFPIDFYKRYEGYYYEGLEYDREGPYKTLDEAELKASGNFCQGVFSTEEEAEEDWEPNHY